DNLKLYTSDYNGHVLVGHCTVANYYDPGNCFHIASCRVTLWGFRPLILSMWSDKLVFFQDQLASQ
ncbi:hypothetical protein Tco_0048679, partial [Tanacetum coccineum]